MSYLKSQNINTVFFPHGRTKRCYKAYSVITPISFHLRCIFESLQVNHLYIYFKMMPCKETAKHYSFFPQHRSTTENLSSVHSDEKVIIKSFFSSSTAHYLTYDKTTYQISIYYFYLKGFASSHKHKSPFVRFKLYLSQLLWGFISLVL